MTKIMEEVNNSEITPAPGLVNLSNEVILECFRYLPIRDLLHSCRLVSKKFHKLATISCRHHKFGIHADRFYEDPCAISTIFSNENLPWSCLDVILSCGYQGSSVNRKLADLYGNYVYELHVEAPEPNFDNLVYMLSRMPNLRVLTVDMFYVPQGTGISYLRFPVKGEVLLSKLQNLEVLFSRVSGMALDFVSFILTKTESHVTSFHLRTQRYDDPKPLLSILELADMPNVSLDLPYPLEIEECALWQELSQQQRSWNVHYLKIGISYSKTRAGNQLHFQFLERFLANCSQLKKLSLSWYSGVALTLTGMVLPLRLPPLPQLKVLDLKYDVRPFALGLAQQFLPTGAMVAFPMHTKNLSAEGFPLLQDLRLRVTEGSSPVDFRHLFDSALGTKLQNVVELKVDCYILGDHWTTLFPNLKVLEATVTEPRCLEEIFKRGNPIAELYIRLKFRMDINLALSQHFFPSNTSAKLKRLVVRIVTVEEGPRVPIADPAVILFSRLPPLDFLKIYGDLDITEDCSAKLRAQHRVVELVNRVG